MYAWKITKVQTVSSTKRKTNASCSQPTLFIFLHISSLYRYTEKGMALTQGYPANPTAATLRVQCAGSRRAKQALTQQEQNWMDKGNGSSGKQGKQREEKPASSRCDDENLRNIMDERKAKKDCLWSKEKEGSPQKPRHTSRHPGELVPSRLLASSLKGIKKIETRSRANLKIHDDNQMKPSGTQEENPLDIRFNVIRQSVAAHLVD
ncbi:unnamed protein product [Orchesella dallaii]|uniref:Uncharacterized protein n=1 Tax=Orchesella dallaii TaxID=48710 RepID=A0ABP1PKQ2_9HEXA